MTDREPLELAPDEILRLAAVAVRECPPDEPMLTDWMDCAMKVCRALASSQQAKPASRLVAGTETVSAPGAASHVVRVNLTDAGRNALTAANVKSIPGGAAKPATGAPAAPFVLPFQMLAARVDATTGTVSYSMPPGIGSEQ